MNKRFIIYATSLLIALVAIGAAYFMNRDEDEDAQLNSALLQTIVQNVPALSQNGESVVQIDSVSRHEEKWYVVTIKSRRPVSTFVPVKVLVLDEGKSDHNEHRFTILLGPDTHFSHEDHDHNGGVDLSAYNIPDAVMAELEL